MKKRMCRNSGLELSELGIGCWSFGGGAYWGSVDQQEVNRIVQQAIDAGINYFDTAEAYNEGRSESSLGAAIRDIPRDSIIIGTKVNPSNCYGRTLQEHCHASLRRLGTGYIDLYMIHWPVHPHSIRHFTTDRQVISHPPDINEAIEALEQLKKQGRIRHYGVSNFGVARLKELPLASVAVNQLPYNLLCRAIEYDVLSYSAGKGIGVIAYIVLMQGILADMYRHLDQVPENQRRTRHFSAANSPRSRHGEKGFEDETGRALEEIRKIASGNGLSMSDVAIRWVLANSDISCALVGSRKADKIRDNIAALDKTIDESIFSELNRATGELKEAMGPHFDYYEAVENDRT